MEILVNEKVVEITQEGVVTTNGQWRKKILGADHVILAAGSKPNRTIGDALKQSGIKFHSIGDCVEARDALDAICEGASAGLKV